MVTNPCHARPVKVNINRTFTCINCCFSWNKTEIKYQLILSFDCYNNTNDQQESDIYKISAPYRF